jgi:FdhD protein
MHRQTRASHASLLCHSDFSILSRGEDVGRHNALDKAIGHLFRKNQLNRARVLLLSSRTSYELIQKAGRAHIPIVFSVSRPTSLAVSLAKRLNITLACLGWPRGLLIFCGARRIRL